MSKYLWPIIIILSAGGLGLITLLSLETAFRPVLAFWFLLICPGMALVRLLGIKNFISEWTIAIALSLALEAGISEIMVFTHTWHPEFALGLLITISLIGAIFQLIQAFTSMDHPRSMDEGSGI